MRRYGVKMRNAERSTSTSAEVPIAARDSSEERQASAVAEKDDGASTSLGASAPSMGASIVSGSSGETLDGKLRRALARSFGADLSNVRIHDDPAAHRFANDIGAKAATLGAHIFFAKGRFDPATAEGRALLRHEIAHTLQSGAAAALHRTPDEDRLREIDRLLATSVISNENRASLESERIEILDRNRLGGGPSSVCNFGGLGGDSSFLTDPLGLGGQYTVITMSEGEFTEMTGMPASSIPESSPLMAPAFADPTQESSTTWAPNVIAGTGMGLLFAPEPNWYYRVLRSQDPTLSQIASGADLFPLKPTVAYRPPPTPYEMTFRQLEAARGPGHIPDKIKFGTDRISTAGDLVNVEQLLGDRGGELARIDVAAARRLGEQFLEHGDVMAQLDKWEAILQQRMAEAIAAGRGTSKIKSALKSVEVARRYAIAFKEGHGVGKIPSKAVTPVPGKTIGEAVAGERALLENVKLFRYGGKVLLVVGIGMSIHEVLSAPSGQRVRVAAQEAGGWAGGWVGAAWGAEAGAEIGAAFGIESGPGVIVTTVLGSIIGGILGAIGGKEAVDAMYDILKVDDVLDQVDTAVEVLKKPETMSEGLIQIFGSDQDKQNYYGTKNAFQGGGGPGPF